jgi:hypothetical protein
MTLEGHTLTVRHVMPGDHEPPFTTQDEKAMSLSATQAISKTTG